MVSYWFPTPVAAWLPLTLAIGFAFLAIFAVVMTLTRRQEERDATRIAAMYGIGLGLVAVTEFMMYIDVAFGASIATFAALSTSVVIFFAIAAAVVAAGVLAVAVTLQFREEGSYRTTHSLAT